MEPVRVIFAGGGTGGHLFPAIAIADELRRAEPNAKILFIGTRTRIEARVVPAAGYAFRPIWISGFHRSLRPGNLLFPVKLVVALLQARSIITTFRPHVVVGTGGYVSGPVLRMAVMLHIPALIQEQNSYPGVTTRVLAPKVNEVHLTFERSKQYFRRPDNLVVSGNPTRATLDGVSRDNGLRQFGFDPDESVRATLLIFGGSLGARSINMAVAQHCETLVNQGYRIIWQCGSEGLTEARDAAARCAAGRIRVLPFIDRMDCAYAAADLVICRAGATTIAELTRLGKPSILIPYPLAAANHQAENAKTLAEAGAAVVIDDAAAGAQLAGAVASAVDGGRLKQMGERSRRLGVPGAAGNIAGRIIRLARGMNP